MKAAVLPGAGQRLDVREVERPTAGPGEDVLKVLANGACHSDLTLAAGLAPHALPTFPWILGHETVGRVEEVGAGVDGYVGGEIVGVHSAWGCGQCPTCRQDMEHLCRVDSHVEGVTLPGAFAEYVRIPNP